MAPNRAQRAKIAQETLDILRAGRYTNLNGDAVDLAEELGESVRGSVAWTEKELDSLRGSPAEVVEGGEVKVEVTGERSIEACRRLAAEFGGVGVTYLNFASAKKVCGGMMGGSLAQEESLGESFVANLEIIRWRLQATSCFYFTNFITYFKPLHGTQVQQSMSLYISTLSRMSKDGVRNTSIEP